MKRNVRPERRARRMTPAEAEFDVTDEAQVSALLASYDGPVGAPGLTMSSQPGFDSFLAPIGSLRTRRS